MSAVTDVLAAALRLSPAERAEFRAKFDEFTAAGPITLHPAWKEELKRRSQRPEADCVSSEEVDRELDRVCEELDREWASRGEG